MKRLILVVLLLGLFTTFFCNILSADESQKLQSDDEIQQKIVGTWTEDFASTNHTTKYIYSTKITMAYASNGNYVAKATMIDNGVAHDEKYEGTWQVKDGFLIATITNAVGIKYEAPKMFAHDKIMQVDDYKLVYRQGIKSTGLIFTYKRSK